MEKYQEYKTLKASSANDLASSVNRALKEGWVPCGSVSIAAAKTDGHGNVTETGKYGLVYIQSMVLPEKQA
jgi:sulfite exporter TauE/SafE